MKPKDMADWLHVELPYWRETAPMREIITYLRTAPEPTTDVRRRELAEILIEDQRRLTRQESKDLAAIVLAASAPETTDPERREIARHLRAAATAHTIRNPDPKVYRRAADLVLYPPSPKAAIAAAMRRTWALAKHTGRGDWSGDLELDDAALESAIAALPDDPLPPRVTPEDWERLTSMWKELQGAAGNLADIRRRFGLDAGDEAVVDPLVSRATAGQKVTPMRPAVDDAECARLADLVESWATREVAGEPIVGDDAPRFVRAAEHLRTAAQYKAVSEWYVKQAHDLSDRAEAAERELADERSRLASLRQQFTNACTMRDELYAQMMGKVDVRDALVESRKQCAALLGVLADEAERREAAEARAQATPRPQPTVEVEYFKDSQFQADAAGLRINGNGIKMGGKREMEIMADAICEALGLPPVKKPEPPREPPPEAGLAELMRTNSALLRQVEDLQREYHVEQRRADMAAQDCERLRNDLETTDRAYSRVSETRDRFEGRAEKAEAIQATLEKELSMSIAECERLRNSLLHAARWKRLAKRFYGWWQRRRIRDRFYEADGTYAGPVLTSAGPARGGKGFEFVFRPDRAVGVYMDAFAELIDQSGAENCIQFTGGGTDGRRFEFTIRRCFGKTPLQLMAEAEQRAEKAEAECQELRQELAAAEHARGERLAEEMANAKTEREYPGHLGNPSICPTCYPKEAAAEKERVRR